MASGGSYHSLLQELSLRSGATIDSLYMKHKAIDGMLRNDAELVTTPTVCGRTVGMLEIQIHSETPRTDREPPHQARAVLRLTTSEVMNSTRRAVARILSHFGEVSCSVREGGEALSEKVFKAVTKSSHSGHTTHGKYDTTEVASFLGSLEWLQRADAEFEATGRAWSNVSYIDS